MVLKFKHHRLNTVTLVILLLGHLDNVYCTDNLAIRGNVVTGETFQIICSGNPDSQGRAAYTFYRSSTSAGVGHTIGTIRFISGEQPPCHTTNTIPYPFGCEDNGSKGYINITVPTDNVYNLTEHNKYWRCSTLSDPTAAYNNVLHVISIVPIAGLSLISPPVSPDNTVTVVSDVPTTFQCQTTQGRPAANITWYIDNAPLSGGKTTTTPVSGDIVITTGSLTLTVNRTSYNKVLSCRATNYVNMEPVESTVKPVIRVKYPPSSPTYTLNVSGISTDVSGSIDVIQGGTLHITCNTVSNPPPATDQYIWTRSNGGSWKHGQQVLTMTDINLSDDAVYTCNVTNTMTPTVGGTRTGTNQSGIAVNVLSQLTMITLKDGDDDPHTWQDIELQEGIQKQLTVEVEPAEALTVVAIYCYIGETSYELSKGTRIFSFITKSVDHGKSVYCKANNIGLDNYKFTQAVKLKVLGKPEPPPFIISGSVDTNSVSLFWLPGYHGDADQTFHIDFRRVNGSWVKRPDVLGGQIQGQLFNVTVSDLKADTRYEFRISASSSLGSRDLFKYAVTRTLSAIGICTGSPSNNIGAAVGGSVGGLAIVVVISVFVVWYCRKTGTNEAPGSKKSMNRERTNTGSSQNDPVSEYYNIGSDIEDRQTTDGSSCYQDLTNRRPVVAPVYQTLDVIDT